MITIPLEGLQFYQPCGRARVNGEYVVMGLTREEFMTELVIKELPQEFRIRGKESSVDMKLEDIRYHDGKVEMWRYEGQQTVVTRDGERKVSVCIYPN